MLSGPPQKYALISINLQVFHAEVAQPGRAPRWRRGCREFKSPPRHISFLVQCYMWGEIFNNIIIWFSSNNLAEKKKTTKKVAKKTTKKVSKKKAKSEPLDSGIVIVDDDLSVDRESELEERRAYLEEARSQEASSD